MTQRHRWDASLVPTQIVMSTVVLADNILPYGTEDLVSELLNETVREARGKASRQVPESRRWH